MAFLFSKYLVSPIFVFFIKLANVTIQDLYQLYLQYPSVQTDTRKIKQGDIFFALSGPNFNGNNFALTALEKGAAYAIVDDDIQGADNRIIRVEDTLITLQELAKYHRKQFNIPFIAITGSNGKTTTKELVSSVLASHFKTYTTQGNLNNHIGIPLTLLQIKKDAEIAVIEMGANHQKEIEGYCEYVEPTHGIITNCGKAHLEGFGGLEGVRKGKGELFDYIRKHHGSLFIFNDYDYLMEMSEGIDKVFTYGTKMADTVGKAVSITNFLMVDLMDESASYTIQTNLVGDYNLPNALCAVSIGKYFNVPLRKIISAIETYNPGNSRSQMVNKDTNHIILDAYNANPSSMKLAIENMAHMKAENKVLFLGGMMELGLDSLNEHQKIIELIEKNKWGKVILVGGEFENVHHTFIYFNSADEATIWAAKQGFTNTYFLVKGSRSMHMEKVVEVL